MNLSQKVVFNTIVQIAAKSITVIFGLLVTILLTGYLGRAGFGDYMYVIALVVIFGAFADWGTATIGVREAAKEKKEQGRVLANIFLVRLVLSIFASLVMVVAALIIPLQTANPLVIRRAIMIGALILILYTTKTSLLVVFQTKLQLQKQAIVDMIISLLILLTSWFFVQNQSGLISLIGAVVLANFVGVVVGFFLAKRTVEFNWRIEKKFVKRLLTESFPMGAILLIFTIDNKIDTVMLGVIKGNDAVGIYAVAYRVYDVLILGAAYFMGALLPVLSRYANLTKWQKKLQQIYQKSFDLMLLMGLIIAGSVWLLAPLVVRIITQQRLAEFGDSILTLRLLGLALFLAYFNHLTGYTIVALGKQRPYFFIALGALVFNIVANILVIPRFSYYGAAAVTIFTEGLLLVITIFFIFRLLKIIPSPFRFPKTAIEFFKSHGKIF